MIRQGDIYWIDLDPTKGHEQGGHRPVLVISKTAFNRAMKGVVVVVPITTKGRFIRTANFGVDLPSETKTTGMIVSCTPRTIDLNARNAAYIEAVPQETLQEVLAKYYTLF